jgi:hypothetical protein
MNAKQMIMKRSTMAKTSTIAAAIALALGAVPIAKADDKGCNVASLNGTFAFSSSGFITVPPAFAGPFAGVGTQTFAGDGTTTAIASQSQNGNQLKVTITGTYTVNPDCTGTLTLQASPGGFTSHFFFVLDDSANELLAICTDPGVVLTRIERRQFLRGDPRQ